MMAMLEKKISDVEFVDIEIENEKKLKTQLEELAGNQLNTVEGGGNSRIGKNLHETQQFVHDNLSVPIKRDRSNSGSSRAKQNAHNNSSNQDVNQSIPPVDHKWRRLKWVKKLYNDCIFMPYGVDNIFT